MSLWSDIASIFTGAVSKGGGVSSLLPLALGAGTAIYGATTSANANVEAAKIAADARAKEADAIREGNQLAQERYEGLMELTEPAQSYLRTVVAHDPNILTPAQKTTMEDIRLSTTRGLNASGLRGSGRSQVAAFRAVESDAHGKMVESNLARADEAARKLSGQYAGAVVEPADLDASTGKAAGSSLAAAGEEGGNLITANTGLRGAAIADIAGLIATDYKDRRRAGKYEKRVGTLTEREERK